MKQRFFMTLSDTQVEGLKALMTEDLSDNVSAYMGQLIANELKRRDELSGKRPVGRPKGSLGSGIDEDIERTDYSEDIPKNIPHFGKMIGKREFADIQAASAAFKSGL